MSELPRVPAGHENPLAAAPVVLVTSGTCTACVNAKPLVVDIAEEFGVGVVEARVEDFPELAQRHGPEIPVLVIDGIPRDFWVIDPVRFRRLLGERV